MKINKGYARQGDQLRPTRLCLTSAPGMIILMTSIQDHPRARQAERARKAAERARDHRERTRLAMLVDAAIVDALADAFAMARPGMLVDTMIVDVAEAALRRLAEAGVEKPKRAFRQRMGLASKAGTESVS